MVYGSMELIVLREMSYGDLNILTNIKMINVTADRCTDVKNMPWEDVT